MNGWKVQFLEWDEMSPEQHREGLSMMSDYGGVRVSGEGAVFAFSNGADAREAHAEATELGLSPKIMYWIG